jgi:hypothetical protein
MPANLNGHHASLAALRIAPQHDLKTPDSLLLVPATMKSLPRDYLLDSAIHTLLKIVTATTAW